jgi:hypothetical protein
MRQSIKINAASPVIEAHYAVGSNMRMLDTGREAPVSWRLECASDIAQTQCAEGIRERGLCFQGSQHGFGGLLFGRATGTALAFAG